MASTENNPEVQESSSPRNILLTSRAKNYIRKGYQLGERLCCHPYVWDDAKGYPEFTTSRLQILSWIFNVIVSAAYFVFLLVQSIRINTSPEEHVSTKATILFATILFSIPVFLQATMVWAGEDLPNYARSSISYLHKFEERYLRDTARPSITARIGGIFMTCMYYGVAVDAILFTLYGLARLDSSEQVSSLFSGYPIVQVPVCLLFWTYYLSCYHAILNTLSSTSFGTLFAFFDVMRELGKEESDFCTEAFRRPQDRVLSYRVLQLQTDATDRVYWIITAACQNVLMLIVMFGSYGAIRLDGIVAIALVLVGATAGFVLIIFLGAWGELDSGSSKAVVHIRKMTMRADILEKKKLWTWLRMSVRSLRPARLPVCGMYYVDKPLILTVGSAISDGIFFLLVNF